MEMHDVYDCESIVLIEKQQIGELIAAILSHGEDLANQIVELRKEINRLSGNGIYAPYNDLHSDIFKNFDCHPVYQEYQEIIEAYLDYDRGQR